MKKLLLAFAIAAIAAAPAFAAETAAPAAPATPAGTGSSSSSEGTCNLNQTLANFESGGTANGGYTADNGRGYIGKYQMGKSALIDTGYMNKSGGWTGKNGINSQADFKANGPVQEQAQTQWQGILTQRTSSLSSYVGKPIPGCGKPLTQSGLNAAAHLVGPGGAASFLQSGGKCGKATDIGTKYNTTDGNGTCAGKYACAGSGCADYKPDYSKDQCAAVMPMINAISCSNYTGETAALCAYALPAKMTEEECKSAEAMSKAAQKGPEKDKCENLTFGPGQGSWSFALACSYAKTGVADGDGAANGTLNGVNGPVSDPACMQKLTAMGVTYKNLGGSVGNGSYGGTTCSVQNAVSLSGTAVPFGATLTMTCDMAIAMEQWGQKMKAAGATSYYGIGSTRPCGPMRDKTGNKPGTITEHALGKAVDVSGFISGGQKISMGGVVSGEAAPLAAKSAACSTFRGVLSPTYKGYVGAYVHFHVEWGRFQGCR